MTCLQLSEIKRPVTSDPHFVILAADDDDDGDWDGDHDGDWDGEEEDANLSITGRDKDGL